MKKRDTEAMRMANGRIAKILVILLILSLIGNVYLAWYVPYSEGQTVEALQQKINTLDAQVIRLQGYMNGSSSLGYGSASMQGPAVFESIDTGISNPFRTASGITKGTMLNITAEIQPGQGRVLVQTEPLMGVVFQDAANTALLVAKNVSGKSLTDIDVIFSVEGDMEVPEVDGPSAGALMASLVIAALSEETPNSDVTLTGTIDSSGQIGAIAGVIEKSEAAKASGKSTILIPQENAQLVQYSESARGTSRFSRVERIQNIVDAKEYIEREVGITVIYVDTIDDVLQYLGLSSGDR